MWSFLMAIVVAAAVGWAVGCCIAETRWRLAQTSGAIGEAASSLRDTASAKLEKATEAVRVAAATVRETAQSFGRNAATQAVPASIGMHLQRRYDDVANEPIPAHLMVLVRRIDNLATV
jgi:ADP-ribosylglycohydrolase